MKAVVCHSYGAIEQLQFETVADPHFNENELLVRVLAAGINFPDGLLVQGLYQAKPELPFIPGMECCGEVINMGRQCTGFAVGDRIICSSPTYGAFAEQLAINAKQAIAITKNIDPVDACNLLVAHGTAHHALQQRACLKAGENLVVLGAGGGTGIAAVQIGKAMGARVIAAASTDEKLELAQKNGADELINYSDENLKEGIKKYTGNGADIIYDPVGGELFDSAIRAMARNGRYLVIGFASGIIPKLPVNLALVKEFSLVGVFWGTFTQKEPQVFASNMETLLTWYEEGKVSVVTDQVYPLEQTALALHHVMSRKVKGKVCVTNL